MVINVCRPALHLPLLAILSTQPASAAPPGAVPFGAYDPSGYFENDADVSIEHVFLPWEDVSLSSLISADQYALERHRALLITVEPWTWTQDERNTPQALRDGILSGRYDVNMREICGVVDTLQSPASIRWGHEMEHADGQFIWAGWAPEDYIAAYRRMVEVCRAAAPRTRFVWSPLGHVNLTEYYPGADVVDIVGLSIFGFQTFEHDILGRELRYEDLLRERYARVAPFRKPVIVAELGYTGNADYVQAWEDAVRVPHPEMAYLVGVVYFNQQEVYPWPNNYGYPDWRVTERVTGSPAGSEITASKSTEAHCTAPLSILISHLTGICTSAR